MNSRGGRRGLLCVSIHDVAAATWPACQRLIAGVQQIAPMPLTLLIVPCWHRMTVRNQSTEDDFVQSLSRMEVSGHELCLHGHVHLDEGRAPDGLRDCVKRRVFTRSEAESAALDYSSASQKIALGLDWFAQRGWTAHGFVPPAWMISPAALGAVRAAGFAYLGLYRSWLRPADGVAFVAPSLTYSTRHPSGDALFRWLQQIFIWRRPHPVLRLALHPADLQRPANLAHAQRLIERCLQERVPLTEYEAFTRLAHDGPVVLCERNV